MLQVLQRWLWCRTEERVRQKMSMKRWTTNCERCHKRFRIVWLPVLVALVACDQQFRQMPDDLPSLIGLMNSDNETTSVAASNKVARVYGKHGLLQVLNEGEPTARAMAARWLVRFPDKEVEDALVALLNRERAPFVRIRALWTLKDIGSPTV